MLEMLAKILYFALPYEGTKQLILLRGLGPMEGKRKIFTITLILLMVYASNIGLVFAPNSNEPVLWFKNIRSEHVRFSSSGSFILAWSMESLTLLNIRGDVVLSIEVENYSSISYATISPKEDIIIVCYMAVEPLESGEEATSIMVAAHNISSEILWSVIEEDALFCKAEFSPNGKYLALAITYKGKRKNNVFEKNIVLELLTVKGDVLWKKEICNETIAEPLLHFTDKGLVVAAGRNLFLISRNGEVIFAKKLSSEIRDMDVSADGSLVAAVEHNMLHVYDSHGVELWNVSTGALLFYVDVSDNGEYVVIGGWKGAWCYDSSGNELWSYVHGKDCITPVTVSNNGYAVVVDHSELTVRAVLINQEGKVFWTRELPKLGVCSSLDITEDASLTVLGSDYGLYLLKGREYRSTVAPLPEIRIAEVTIINKPPLLWILHCNDSLRSVQLLKDGSLLAVTEGWIHYITSNGTIAWSKPVGPPLKALATENYIIVASLRKVILLSRSGEELWLRNIDDNVEALAFLNNKVVAVTWGNVYLISLKGKIEANVEITTPEEPKLHIGSPWVIAKTDPSENVVAVAYSYTSSVLALINSKGETLWFINLNTPIMALSLTRTKLILGLGNGTVLAIDFKEKRVLWRKTLIPNRKAPIINVVASENGEYIVVNSKDGIMYMLSGSGKILWTYPKEYGKEQYTYSTLSRDSTYVIGYGSHVILLDRNGKVLWKRKVFAEAARENYLSITPDLTYLAVIYSGNDVQYFKMEEVLQQTMLHEVKELSLIPYSILLVAILIVAFIIILKRVMR